MVNYPGQSVEDLILFANANSDDITLTNLTLQDEDYSNVVAATGRTLESRDVGVTTVTTMSGGTTIASRLPRMVQVLLAPKEPEDSEGSGDGDEDQTPTEEPTDP